MTSNFAPNDPKSHYSANISSIQGKKSRHQMIIPPEQQQSMKRFLTPGRAPHGGGADGTGGFNTIANNIQSIQRLRHDESKGMIAHSNK